MQVQTTNPQQDNGDRQESLQPPSWYVQATISVTNTNVPRYIRALSVQTLMLLIGWVSKLYRSISNEDQALAPQCPQWQMYWVHTQREAQWRPEQRIKFQSFQKLAVRGATLQTMKHDFNR